MPLLLAPFFGRAELGATISCRSRRGVRDSSYLERAHQQRGQIVAGAHGPWPAGRRLVEREAVRRSRRVGERAHEALPFLRVREELDGARDRISAGWRGKHVWVYEARTSATMTLRSLPIWSG